MRHRRFARDQVQRVSAEPHSGLPLDRLSAETQGSGRCSSRSKVGVRCASAVAGLRQAAGADHVPDLRFRERSFRRQRERVRAAARMARRQTASTASSCRAPTSTRANMSPPRSERLKWLTGFTGSAGVALILREPRRHFRRRPLHAAGARAGRSRRFSRSRAWSTIRRRNGSRTISARARGSASIRGCTRSARSRR